VTEWEKEELKLRSGHGWRARPGHKIFVIDRGAVRFDYPQEWVVIPDEKSVTLHDREPPNDEVRLQVSYLRLPSIDWSGLSLASLVEAGMEGDERSIRTRGPIKEMRRDDLELAWREIGFVDSTENRDARSRLCIARRSNLQCLITFDFWATDLPRCDDVWNTILATLEMGEYVADPQRGRIVS
jgi:hypothetical protein